MAITISDQAYSELLQEVDDTAQHFDPSDPLHVTWKYPQLIGQGFIREIQLRQGLELEIFDACLHDRLMKPLKAGTLERVHYAKTLLLRNLHNPPSLVELAQQAKLNEYTLKQGFRQVFGTTVFGIG